MISYKIAIIHFGKKGAGPVYSFEMAKALYRQGHEVFFYTSKDSDIVNNLNGERFKIRLHSTYNTKIEYLKSIICQKEINKVAHSIKDDNPDVIYLTMNDLWAPFLFPKLKGFLRVKTIHDVGIHEGNNSIFNKWWNSTNFRDAEKFVILSKIFVTELEKKGISKSNIVVIPHAGFTFYADQYHTNNSNTVKKIILFFGRIDKYKGLEILLDAMPMIIEKHPDVLLRIAGNGDLQDLIFKIEKLHDNIELINRWIKDCEIADIMRDCLLLILPYTHATQSGVIPLAYAFQKPVIATNVGGLGEQIVEGVTGHIIMPQNAKIISEYVNRMLFNLDKTEKMGKNAYQYMIDNLTWESSARKFIQFVFNGSTNE